MLKKKIIYLFIILFSLLICSSIHGTMEFLEIGVGSSMLGTGEAGIAKCKDFTTAYWNPAGLGMIDHIMAGIYMFLYYEDMLINNLSVIYPYPGLGVFGISSTYIKDDIFTTTMDTAGGMVAGHDNFSFFNINITASYSRNIFRNNFIGANIKYIHSSIEEESAQTIAIDAGWVGRDFLSKDFNLGAVILNIGPKVKYMEESEPLPMALKIGLSMKVLSIKDQNHQLYFMNDYVIPFYNKYSINTGLEYVFRNYFIVRGGYQYSVNRKQLTAGAGLNLDIGNKQLLINAAFMPQQDFDHLLCFDVSMRF